MQWFDEVVFTPEMLTPASSGVRVGKSPEYRVAIHDTRVTVQEMPETPSVFWQFAKLLGNFAPSRHEYIGTAFFRELPADAVAVNETHRDKGGPDVLNFTCMIAEVPAQLEFFESYDIWEARPIITPNGCIQMFQKELHRRPDVPAGSGQRMFMSANLRTTSGRPVFP